VYTRHVDSSSLVFSLSSHRHSYISLVFRSHFIHTHIHTHTHTHTIRNSKPEQHPTWTKDHVFFFSSGDEESSSVGFLQFLWSRRSSRGYSPPWTTINRSLSHTTFGSIKYTSTIKYINNPKMILFHPNKKSRESGEQCHSRTLGIFKNESTSTIMMILLYQNKKRREQTMMYSKPIKLST
jgi:hypothetical protein